MAAFPYIDLVSGIIIDSLVLLQWTHTRLLEAHTGYISNTIHERLILSNDPYTELTGSEQIYTGSCLEESFSLSKDG